MTANNVCYQLQGQMVVMLSRWRALLIIGPQDILCSVLAKTSHLSSCYLLACIRCVNKPLANLLLCSYGVRDTPCSHALYSQCTSLSSAAQACRVKLDNCTEWDIQWIKWHCGDITAGSACCLQFRFIVDGVWKWADDQPVMRDEEGNYINVLEVHEFVPENLESLSGFEPPPSPPSRCFACLYVIAATSGTPEWQNEHNSFSIPPPDCEQAPAHDCRL